MHRRPNTQTLLSISLLFTQTNHQHKNHSLSVLASKGIDASLVDKRVEMKASVPRLTGKTVALDVHLCDFLLKTQSSLKLFYFLLSRFFAFSPSL